MFLAFIINTSIFQRNIMFDIGRKFITELNLNDLVALAELANNEAMAELGARYYKGLDVLQDYSKASEWFLKSIYQESDLENKFVQHLLGYMYEEGSDAPKDLSQAEYWYRKSAEQGNGDSQYQLGSMYQEGKGVPQDYKLAAEWYEKAAGSGTGSSGVANLVGWAKLAELRGLPLSQRKNLGSS
jgi:TPR repeat protein